MGEHGDSQIVPLSRVSVGGKPFAKLQKEYPDTLGKITIEDLQDEVRQAGMTVIIGKKSTEFGIGIALSGSSNQSYTMRKGSGRFLSIWMGSMDRKTWQQEFRP